LRININKMGSMAPSLFSSLPEVAKDEVFSLMASYQTDPDPSKVNLGPGIYRCDEGKSWPLKVVSQVEKSLYELQDLGRHDYLAIEGDPRFLRVARDLVFSSAFDSAQELQQSTDSRIVSVQSISGTGANHIGARFLAENLRPRRVWLSDPTWANHHAIWESVGVDVHTYPYYDKDRRALNFDAMMTTLEREARSEDVIVLHACAHNPTGIDPSREQWVVIAELCQRKQLFPFFDSAYQGFASGSPTQDAWALCHFYNLQPRMEMCVAQSFSKNFGLYGQRAGAFHLVMNDPCPNAKDRVLSTLSQIIRSEYSVSPRYGSTIIRTILEDPTLSKGWLADLAIISGRIKSMRIALYDELCRLHTPGSWVHVVDQVRHAKNINFVDEAFLTTRSDWHVLLYGPHSLRSGHTSGTISHLHAIFWTGFNHWV